MPSSRELLNAQGLIEVSAESFDRSGDGGGVAAQDRQVTEAGSLLSHQEPVDNFPRDQWLEDPRFGGGIQEPDDPHHGVQQMHIQRTDGDGPHLSRISRRGVTGFNHNLTDEGGGELQAQTEEGPLLRGGEDLTDVGQIDRHQKIVEGVIPIAALAQ
jgi:hypothetical protein